MRCTSISLYGLVHWLVVIPDVDCRCFPAGCHSLAGCRRLQRVYPWYPWAYVVHESFERYEASDSDGLEDTCDTSVDKADNGAVVDCYV